jgi:hypothetical protein
MDMTALLIQVIAGVGGTGSGQLAGSALGGGAATQAGLSAVVGALLPLIVGMLKKA